jgi:hypothetical protein
VDIGISDFGVGIPTVIRTKYPNYPDGRAILLATDEGITTKSSPRNSGAGLSVLIDYVVGYNGGKIEIRSGSGFVHCYQMNERIIKRSHQAPGYYPGTIFNITLRTDRIKFIEDERENLEW